MSDLHCFREINTSFAKTRDAIRKKTNYLRVESGEDYEPDTTNKNFFENNNQPEECSVENAAAAAAVTAINKNDDKKKEKKYSMKNVLKCDDNGDEMRVQGLEKEFIPYTRNVVYEYYNDYNKLCERLQLLISSKLAGNSNHDQEINSIICELRSNKIVV